MDKQQIRQWVWDELTQRRQTAFPMPVHGRIPNFVGAAKAAERLREWPVYKAARVVKVGPDSPLHPIRAMILRDGKRLYMPTPKLTAGFVLLHDIEPGREREATSLTNFKQFGQEVALTEIEPIDLVVAGTVAVSRRSGVRIGKGAGYGDMEFALLNQLGKLRPDTPVATSVHDLQVVDDPEHPLGVDLPFDPHDISCDCIVTPTRTLMVQRTHPQPTGIDWSLLEPERLSELQPLLELRKMQGGIRP